MQCSNKNCNNKTYNKISWKSPNGNQHQYFCSERCLKTIVNKTYYDVV